MATPFVIALLLLLALGGGNVRAELVCSTEVLIELGSSPQWAKCVSDTGTKVSPTMSHLSFDEIKVFCDSPACAAFMEQMRATGLGDCRIVGTSSHLISDGPDAFDAKCSAISSTESSGGATANDLRESITSSATSSVKMIATSCLATITLMLLI
uniref:Elicitin n=1 Tax=Peronospora matthiolae TaxID=2874970 RepID=A0AAV1UQQ8_9STRA